MKNNIKVLSNTYLNSIFSYPLWFLYHSGYFFEFSVTMSQRSVVRLKLIYNFAVLLENSGHIESVFAVLVRKCGSFQK